MAHIRQRGKSWQATITYVNEKGEKKQETLTRKTKEEANIDGFSRELQLRKMARTDIDVTVGDVLVRFLMDRKTTKRGSTYISHEWACRRLQPLQLCKARNLSTQQIQSFLDSERDTLSYESVRRIRGALSAAFNCGAPQVVPNPVKKTSVRADDREEYPSIPTREQVEEFIALADEKNRQGGVMARFLAGTGCRVGEMCSLRWSSIKIKPDGSAEARISTTITRATNGRRIEGKKTKAGPSRTVILSADLLARMQALGTDEFVFTTRSGRFLDPPNVAHLFTVFWDQVAPERDWSPCHGLRHYCASMMLDAGIPPLTVCKCLGWKSLAMLDQRYGHALGETVTRAFMMMQD